MTTTTLARTNGAAPDLSTVGPVQLHLQNLAEIVELGKLMAATGFFKDVNDAGRAVAKMLYGAELGIGPMVALMDIDIIEGAPSPSANLIGGLIKKSRRYNYRVRESTAIRCAIEFFERDGDAWESAGVSTYTWEQASAVKDKYGKALTSKPVWQSYPDAMLFARAMTAGARKFCPDVFGGAAIYTAEELGAPVEYNPATGTMTAQVVPPPALPAPVTPSGEPVNPATGEIVEGTAIAVPAEAVPVRQVVVAPGDSAAWATLGRTIQADQKAEIGTLVECLGWSGRTVVTYLQGHYQVKSRDSLTATQAAEMIADLQGKLAESEPAL